MQGSHCPVQGLCFLLSLYFLSCVLLRTSKCITDPTRSHNNPASCVFVGIFAGRSIACPKCHAKGWNWFSHLMPCSVRKCCPKSSCCLRCLPSWIVILLQYTWHLLHPPRYQDLFINLFLFRCFQAGSQVPSFRPYLLALLTHQSSWTTLHQCIRLLLGRNREQRWVLFVRPSQGIELGNSVWERTRPAMFMMCLPGDVSQPKTDFVRRMLISVLLICVPWYKYYLLFDGGST